MKKQVVVKELNAKTNSELTKELVELNHLTVKLRMDAAMRRLKNVKSIAEARHRVARILTILNERALQGETDSEVTK